jgi:hypothetical protein
VAAIARVDDVGVGINEAGSTGIRWRHPNGVARDVDAVARS